jgi:hypothetical protein
MCTLYIPSKYYPELKKKKDAGFIVNSSQCIQINFGKEKDLNHAYRMS